MASLITKYKTKQVSQESETLKEVQEQTTPAPAPAADDLTMGKDDLNVTTIEESDTNDKTNAVDGEKDNDNVSTENDGVEVADIKMDETVQGQGEQTGEKVVTDTTVLETFGQDAQAEPAENHSTTEVLHDENDTTGTDGKPVEPAEKELAVGSTEALAANLLNVLNNNTSLEAQNPFVIQALKAVDRSLGFDPSKKSYTHFTSLEQIKTGLEKIVKAFTK